LIEERVVGFWEEAFGLLRQLVCEVRLAHPPLDAALPDEAVPLKAQEVCADGVVGQPELFRQLVHGADPAAQQPHHTPACAVEEPLVKFC
jgi:hypothetical protein